MPHKLSSSPDSQPSSSSSSATMGSLPKESSIDNHAWYQDGYMCTTDKSYIDAEVLRGIFDSDLMWWNKPMDIEATKQMLDNCMVFAIYSVEDTESEMRATGHPSSPPSLVGFSRLVTDLTTFAYLTDVFVLPSHQRRGLAGWMMRCIREVLSPWPYLRGLVLMTENEKKAQFYRKELGAMNLQDGPSKGLVLLEMPGRAEVAVPEGAVAPP